MMKMEIVMEMAFACKLNLENGEDERTSAY